MINWRKPIETVGGRKARLVEANIETGRIIVYTYSGSGDVFLVDEEGYRRDERASDSERQEPVIRNVRIKRKAWIRLPIHDYYKGDTKEEIESQITSPD